MKEGQVSVLVVDEEPSSAKIIKLNLESIGYAVRTATEKRTAMDLLFSDEMDLIVLGAKMPDFDGYEVCRRLRESSNVPIILLATQDTVADQLKAFQMGADDFVAKPFNIDELVARVRAKLRRVAFAKRWDSDSFILAPQVSREADLAYNVAVGDA